MNAWKAKNQVLVEAFEVWRLEVRIQAVLRLAFILLLLDKFPNRWPPWPDMRCKLSVLSHITAIETFTEKVRCFGIDCG